MSGLSNIDSSNVYSIYGGLRNLGSCIPYEKNSNTMDSRLTDFTRITPSTFIGSKFNKEFKDFLYDV